MESLPTFCTRKQSQAEDGRDKGGERERDKGTKGRNKHDKASGLSELDSVPSLFALIYLLRSFDLEFVSVSWNNNPPGNSRFVSWLELFFRFFFLNCMFVDTFYRTKNSRCFSWLFIINFEYESLPVATTCAGSSTNFVLFDGFRFFLLSI